MSKAFTKEDDGPENDRLADLPQSAGPNYVTPAGLAALHDRLAERRAELAALRARGDDLGARFPISVTERDIRFLEERINRALPVDGSELAPDTVAFGAEIEVEDDAGRRRAYRIVGEDEADPSRGLIAPASPLAAALLGAKVGDLVEWPKPSGPVDLRIVAVSFS